MRTKLYVGLFVTAIVGIVAGERFFNRLRGAQEPPKTAQAGDKKDVPGLPPLPAMKNDKGSVPPLAVPASVPPIVMPTPLPTKKEETPKASTFEFPPLSQIEPKASLPAPVLETKTEPPPPILTQAATPSDLKSIDAKPTVPVVTPQVEPRSFGNAPAISIAPQTEPNPVGGVPPVKSEEKFTFPPIPGDKAPPIDFKPVDAKKEILAEKMTQLHALLKENKLKEAETILNQIRAIDPDYIPAMAARRMVEAKLLQEKESTPAPVKPVEHTTPAAQDAKPIPTVPVPPSPAIAQQIAKLKSSPWSLKIEMVDGQTVVSGTVNHKHTFKIACNSLELNTGKDWLKAIGKVTISGDMMTGQCEMLQIALLDDRLVLEGGAEVRIQKTISDAKPTSFELKGDTLNLRISDLNAAKLTSTGPNGWRQVSNSSGAIPVRPATNVKDAQWSKWGTLRRMEDKSKTAGESVWCLEERGAPILILVARDGGTLSQYEGRRISVYGTNEQIANETMLRVSHIALP